DPHTWPYPIYAAAATGDAFGENRINWMMDLVKPDVVVLQNDPWNIPMYVKRLKAVPEHSEVPIVGVVAVDGKNCGGSWLNDLSLAIFWTQFGLDEARKGGFTQPGVVIPLGVDLDIYKPGNRRAAREKLVPNGFPTEALNGFIVGNV